MTRRGRLTADAQAAGGNQAKLPAASQPNKGGLYCLYACSSPGDRALDLSRWLFGSNARVGQLRPKYFSEASRGVFAAKLALAMVLAYGIALSVDWDKPI